MRWVLCAMLIAGMGLSTAEAWSNKEHIQLTRIAAERLVAHPTTPPAMRDWLMRASAPLMNADAEKAYFLHKRVGPFARGADALPFWAIVPDMTAMADKYGRKVEPFGVSEAKLHYIDLELFMPDPSQQTYADDLSHRPKLTQIPHDLTDERYKTAGMLPFRVEQAYRQMVSSLRAGRLDDAPGQYPRDDHATMWAGCLAHYLQDSTQPHHATEDYKSRSSFKGIEPSKAPDVHGDMEYRLGDDDTDDYKDLRQVMWAAFAEELQQLKDPVQTKDPWQSTVEVCLISYEALPMIGRAAKLAYPKAGPDGPGPWKAEAFFYYAGDYRGRSTTVLRMKAHQWAWAVKRVEKLWRQAWDEAHAARQ